MRGLLVAFVTAQRQFFTYTPYVPQRASAAAPAQVLPLVANGPPFPPPNAQRVTGTGWAPQPMAAFVGGAAAAYALTKRYGEPRMQFSVGGKKKSPEERLEEKGYWPGEWVCADCGYIYDNIYQSLAFEELRQRWKCPQCAGPRRRFVKKAGGITAAVDDSPLLIGTVAAGLLIVVLVYLGLTL